LAKPDYVSGSKLIESLLFTTSRLTFQIAATPAGTTWQVIDPTGATSPQVIQDHVRSYGDNTRVVENAGATPRKRFPWYRQMVFFGLTNDYAAPIAQLWSLKTYDPLATFSQHVGFIREDRDERITYTLMTLVASPEAKVQAARRIKEGMIRPLSPMKQTQ